jgi:hypothetical protein
MLTYALSAGAPFVPALPVARLSSLSTASSSSATRAASILSPPTRLLRVIQLEKPPTAYEGTIAVCEHGWMDGRSVMAAAAAACWPRRRYCYCFCYCYRCCCWLHAYFYASCPVACLFIQWTTTTTTTTTPAGARTDTRANQSPNNRLFVRTCEKRLIKSRNHETPRAFVICVQDSSGGREIYKCLDGCDGKFFIVGTCTSAPVFSVSTDLSSLHRLSCVIKFSALGCLGLDAAGKSILYFGRGSRCSVGSSSSKQVVVRHSKRWWRTPQLSCRRPPPPPTSGSPTSATGTTTAAAATVSATTPCSSAVHGRH